MSTYRDVIAEGLSHPQPPLWHPTRWVAGVFLTVDILRGRRHIHVHPATAWTDDTHEPFGTAYTGPDDVSDQEAEEIRKTDQARAIALAENTYYGGIH